MFGDATDNVARRTHFSETERRREVVDPLLQDTRGLHELVAISHLLNYVGHKLRTAPLQVGQKTHKKRNAVFRAQLLKRAVDGLHEVVGELVVPVHRNSRAGVRILVLCVARGVRTINCERKQNEKTLNNT